LAHPPRRESTCSHTVQQSPGVSNLPCYTSVKH
jgi:hypothetical protein